MGLGWGSPCGIGLGKFVHHGKCVFIESTTSANASAVVVQSVQRGVSGHTRKSRKRHTYLLAPSTPPAAPPAAGIAEAEGAGAVGGAVGVGGCC